MKKIILSALFFTFFLISYAGSASIKGTIIDAGNREPIPYANIILYEDNKKEPLKGTTTDENGNFSMDNLNLGKYQLEISFIGYKQQIIPIVLSEDALNLKLRKIKLQEDVALLKEVEVVGKRTSLQMDIDKKVFLVNESALSEGVSTSEILKEIPSVDVDVEGNISLRNSESVDVFINGKPSGLTSENRGDILEQLPAGSVEKIEIITNPSAKYNAEGSAGIINIILKKDRKAGYFGTISAGVNYPWNGKVGGNIGGNINYSSGKFDAYASIGYFNRRNYGGGYNNRRQFGQDTTFLNQNSTNNFDMNSGFLRLGMDYRINTKNTFGISGMTSIGKRNREEEIDYRKGIILNNIENINLRQLRDNSSNMDREMYNLSVDYKHLFEKDGEELTASFGFSNNQGKNESEYNQKDYDENGIFIENSNSLQKQNTDDEIYTYEIQADYVNPLNSFSKIEAGYKSRFQNSVNDVKSYLKNGQQIDLSEQKQLFNNFELNQNIHALYASYGGKIKQLSMKFGLRGELTDINWEQHITNEKSNEKPYFNLFPTAFLSYQLPGNNEIQISYTRRINRPNGRRLNPFVNITDSANISFGNPDLKPEFTNSIELNYIKTFEAHILTASLYYKITEDVIQSYSWLENSVLKKTFANLTSSQSSGLELIAKNRFKYISLTSSINLYYYKLNGGNFSVDQITTTNEIIKREVYLKDKESLSWTAKLSADISLPAGITAQLSGNYRSSQSQAQGKSLNNYTINIGAKKYFWDRKISAALTIRDLLDSRKNKSETWDNDFYQVSENYRSGRMLNFNLTYSFGNMKMSKKSKKAEMDGDDMMDDF